MASTRLMYDECNFREYLTDTKNIIDYTLYNGKYNHTAKCLLDLGQDGSSGGSIFSGSLVDLESDLRGQTRKLSKCTNTLFQPKFGSCRSATAVGESVKLTHQPSCSFFNK
jgi:hypothetical protein